MWYRLLLSKENLAFGYLPVESITYDRQQEYCATINATNETEASAVFIVFMLSAIKA